MTKPTGPLTIWRWVFIAVFTASWLLSLGFRPLTKTDEGRYAEISREMVVSGDWLTPRLNNLKYFEKPPLQYWATAAAFKVLGTQEWVARLWTGLTGLWAVLITAWGASRLYGQKIGIYSGAILGTCLSFFLMGHLNALDMGFCAMLTTALWALIAAHTSPTQSSTRGWMLTAWAAMALAVLSKGLAGVVLPGAVLVIYCVLARDKQAWLQANWLRGLFVFLLIAAPWFSAMSVKNPGFSEFFFIHEHFDRFAKEGHRRDGPLWYFVPQLLAGLLPWTLLLPGALWVPFGKRESGYTKTSPQARAGATLHPVEQIASNPRFKPELLLLVWTLFIFAFFSASKSKLPSYIIPIFPSMAVLMAVHFDQLQARGVRVFFGLLTLLAVIALLILGYTYTTPDKEYADKVFAACIAGGVVLIMAASAAAGLIRPGPHTTRSVLWVATAASLCHSAIILGHQVFSPEQSTAVFAKPLASVIQPNEPVYSIERYEQSLPFYLKRPVTLVNYRDEFDFGLNDEPGKGIDTVEAFKTEWMTLAQGWAYMSADMYLRLTREGLPMIIRFQNNNHTLVSKQ